MADQSHNQSHAGSWAERCSSPKEHRSHTSVQSEHMTCDSIQSSENPTDGTNQKSLEHNNSVEKKPDEKFTSEIDNMKKDREAVYINMDKHPLHYPSAPYKRLEHPADKSLLASFFLSIIFLIFALALFCPVMGLVSFLVPFSVIVRRCMDCCCCCCGGNSWTCSCCCSDILSNQDAYWLHDTPFNKMIVQTLLTLESGLPPSRIKDLIQARLVCAENKNGKKLYPRFTRKVIPLNAGWAWENDDNFSINNHVIPVPITITTQADLEEYVSDLASVSLDSERPMWELHVLPNFGPEKDTVLIFRMHPCMTDGISMVHILMKALADDSSPSCNTKQNFASRILFFNIVRAIIVGPLVFIHKWIFTRKDYNVFHGPSLSKQKQVVWSEPYSMDALTRIKQVTRSTFNDVIMSVATGAIRTYQQCLGVEHPFDMLATMPVDLRSEGFAKISMGNRFTMLDVPLPTNTEGAIPRLWEFRHRMEEVKNSADPPIMYGLTSILLYIFPQCIAHRILSSIYNHSTCVISNLMGPSLEQTFATRRIKDIIYWMPPRDDVALSLSFITYGNHIRMAVLCDQNLVPSPEIMTKEFNLQLDMLAQLLSNRRIPGEHSSRRMESFHDPQQEMPEPSIEELQRKMQNVQQQLQELKAEVDSEDENYDMEEHALSEKIEQLRDEFRELLIEMRRRRAAENSNILSDDEENDDGELRRASMRRRTLSTASRRISIVSHTSMSRPLTTASAGQPTRQSSQASHDRTPPSSPMSSSYVKGPDPPERERESSPTSDQSKHLVTHEQVMVQATSGCDKDSYSPQVERKTATVVKIEPAISSSDTSAMTNEQISASGHS